MFIWVMNLMLHSLRLVGVGCGSYILVVKCQFAWTGNMAAASHFTSHSTKTSDMAYFVSGNGKGKR
jgi:hypothetical protein